MSAVVNFGTSKSDIEVNGESKLKDHEGWCDIKHFSFGMESPRQLHSGASTKRRQYDTIKITKLIDLASVSVWSIGIKNDSLKEMKIHLIRNRDNAKEVFFEYVLKNASLASIRQVASMSDKDQPEEELAFTFEEITMTYVTAGLGDNETSNISEVDQWSSGI